MANYSKGAGKEVKEAMHEMKEGKLKSGRSGKKVTSRKQAIAIGLSEAKERGAKVPAKKTASKGTGRKAASKSAGGRRAASKSTARKTASKSTGRSQTAAKKTGRTTAIKRGTKAAPRKRASKKA